MRNGDSESEAGFLFGVLTHDLPFQVCVIITKRICTVRKKKKTRLFRIPEFTAASEGASCLSTVKQLKDSQNLSQQLRSTSLRSPEPSKAQGLCLKCNTLAWVQLGVALKDTYVFLPYPLSWTTSFSQTLPRSPDSLFRSKLPISPAEAVPVNLSKCKLKTLIQEFWEEDWCVIDQCWLPRIPDLVERTTA